MYTLLLIVLLFICAGLMLAILLQSGKGGGLAAGFGGSGTGIEMMGSRQTATFLHNATKWLGGAFLVVCFAISLLTVRGTRPRSLIERDLQNQAPPAAAPQAPVDLQDALGDEPTSDPSAAGAAPTEAEPEATAAE